MQDLLLAVGAAQNLLLAARMAQQLWVGVEAAQPLLVTVAWIVIGWSLLSLVVGLWLGAVLGYCTREVDAA